MVERLIAFSARNRLLVFLLVGLLAAAGYFSMARTPLDALPDISDTQVIVYTTWPGRSPTLVEDQVTYPVVTSLLAAPGVKVVRGLSDFGYSYVYVLFEDGTDIYWARSRVLEYLSQIRERLPAGVSPALGPDATGVGWVYQYALITGWYCPDHPNGWYRAPDGKIYAAREQAPAGVRDRLDHKRVADKPGRCPLDGAPLRRGQQDLAQLRSLQDWNLRYAVASVDGVAEVASVGGHLRQYQVTVEPNRLLAYNMPLQMVIEAIRRSNNDVGGRVVEMHGTEYMVRGLGYIRSLQDIEDVAVGAEPDGTPIYVRDLAEVTLGPEMRRGVAELDGRGEVVGGIVIMRHMENALSVIRRVEARLEELRPTLPPGVDLYTVYDRSGLIGESIGTATSALVQEMAIVGFMILFFLLHVRSALIPILTLPFAILIAFLPMAWLQVTTNVMTLGGIIIAIGDMVDASIVMVENAHTQLADWEAGGRQGSRVDVIIRACQEVGPPIFASLLVMAVAFLPIFTLEAQEGRMFKPLALTKNFAIGWAALLAVTLTPALMTLLLRGRIRAEDEHPVVRVLARLYTPLVRAAVRWRWATVALAVVALLATVPAFQRLGSEFMPPLEEGSILFMPTTLPGVSVTEATKLLQVQDRILKQFPEVRSVFGKSGRAETSTDPAPFSMIETTVVLKPKAQWRPGMTFERLTAEMDQALRMPGVSNAWTMPVRGRIDMLTTGIRTPVGIKVFGPDLAKIQEIGTHLEAVLKQVPGTRGVYAERVQGGYYLDFKVRRRDAARYGMTVEAVEEIIEAAIGGMNVTTTVEGRERYPVSVRYPRGLREDLDRLSRVLVATPRGTQVPISLMADIQLNTGPAMIRDEDGMLSGYVFVDVASRDIGGYVAAAKAAVAGKLKPTPGYRLVWSGQYEFLERVRQRLQLTVPLTLGIIFLLYFFAFRSAASTLMIMLSVPFALVGGIWLLFGLGYNLSIAVWVGLIALAGVAAETAALMIAYLDEACRRVEEQGRLRSRADLIAAIVDGSARRLRPMMMTVGANVLGLMPVMWATGTGADVMKRISAPMIGGMTSAVVLTLLVIPAIYAIWHGRLLPPASAGTPSRAPGRP